MAVHVQKLLDNFRLDDEPTSIVAPHNFNGIAPRRVSFYIEVVMTNSPTNLTFSVDLSPDDGQNLIDYPKLISRNGTDQPVTEVVYTASTEDVVSISPEDVTDYIQVSAIVTGTTSSAYFTISLWMVYDL